MTDAGIWDRIKLSEVKANLATGVIRAKKELVGDTTHYHAYSGFETVRYEDEKRNEQKKSQSKPPKNCRCADWESCSHEWELRDEGAGTLVKSGRKMIWGHKASIIGLPEHTYEPRVCQGQRLPLIQILESETGLRVGCRNHGPRAISIFPVSGPPLESKKVRRCLRRV
jgi:hypothetical protein